LVFTALFLILYASTFFADQKSDTLYSILETKKAETIVGRLINSEAVCFTLDNNSLGRFAFLADSIKNADEEASLPLPPTAISINNRYDGFLNGANSTDVVPLIRQYLQKFNHTSETMSIRNYTDEVHTFECNFAYNGNQYYLIIKFQSLTALTDYGGFVPIDTTAKSKGSAANRYVTYYPFNNTAVWTNHLGLTISLDLRTVIDNQTVGISTKIPAGKSWDYRLQPDYSISNDTIYHYQLRDGSNRPDSGEIIVKHYPRCMSQQIAKSLYLQTSVGMKFPAYLPKGYLYICGVEFYDTVLLQTYWNQTVDDPSELKYGEEKEDFTNYASHPDATKSGIIVVYGGKSGILLPHSDAQSRFDEIKNETYYINQQLITVHNQYTGAENQAVVYEHNVYDEKDISILELYDEHNHEIYYFKGKVPSSELIKMAESLKG
jgi:hypothetical protein